MTASSKSAGTGVPLGRGFRYAVWLGVALVVGAGVLAVSRRGGRAGGGIDGALVDLTLVTADRTEVACASSERVAPSYACGFRDDGKPLDIGEASALHPYMTLDRRLFLIPGLFLEPGVARRYAAEPPAIPHERLRRFTARCRLSSAGRMEGFRLRWAHDSAWSEPQSADVVLVGSCQILG